MSQPFPPPCLPISHSLPLIVLPECDLLLFTPSFCILFMMQFLLPPISLPASQNSLPRFLSQVFCFNPSLSLFCESFLSLSPSLKMPPFEIHFTLSLDGDKNWNGSHVYRRERWENAAGNMHSVISHVMMLTLGWGNERGCCYRSPRVLLLPPASASLSLPSCCQSLWHNVTPFSTRHQR